MQVTLIALFLSLHLSIFREALLREKKCAWTSCSIIHVYPRSNCVKVLHMVLHTSSSKNTCESRLNSYLTFQGCCISWTVPFPTFPPPPPPPRLLRCSVGWQPTMFWKKLHVLVFFKNEPENYGLFPWLNKVQCTFLTCHATWFREDQPADLFHQSITIGPTCLVFCILSLFNYWKLNRNRSRTLKQ